MKKILVSMIFVLLFYFSAFAQSENARCPSVTVTGPSSVIQLDEAMFFAASVGSDEKNYSVKYKWTVDKGTIINGQGTRTIQVSTEGLSDTTVTATFEIEGLPKDCVNKDSEIGVVASEIIGEPFADYRKLSIKDELERFDSFLVTIKLDYKEDYSGFIVIYTDEKNLPALKKRLKILANHLDRRKFSRERITFAINKEGEGYTYLWIVPPGAEPPKCEKCEIIKASDIK